MIDIEVKWTRRASAMARGGVALVLAQGLFLVSAEAQFIPFQDDPIRYYVDRAEDPVAKVQARIERGEKRLEFEGVNGYLKSVLRELDVPLSSQALVYSKSSLQFRKVSPKTPRALYFNDDVYVGWIKGGEFLEIVSFDANQGAIFYTLDQTPTASRGFTKAELDCIQCHVGGRTRGVPGVLLRSIVTNGKGNQTAETRTYLTDHRSPFAERWGGWYVTGTHGRQTHLGNLVVDSADGGKVDATDGNVVDLSSRFPIASYPTPHSDIVAHLVLDHQAQLHNLITVANYQTRLALHAEKTAGRGVDAISAEARRKIEEPSEELVRYLLFAGEAPLTEPVVGDSGFTREFSARGPRDGKGRSLRDFDLTRRIFKYPCSYLIYTAAFDALPKPAKDYVYRRLFEVLTNMDRSPAFAHLSPDDRRAILEILVATKPGLPESWKQVAADKTTSGPASPVVSTGP
ncbi:MAG: hypothetical protein P4L85_23270 [Paludisphaera borealis]|uniref:hypothetical protein n=1 Tax=Paludisphaera borealis TaxID=1387353 RepID=UPI00284E1EE8|nr:hypothetical protein [Paludisphaera borealis]MDR3622291.1 hypothetical protein [Paludisphaera borealis]